jgi:hypothetical protein
MLVSQSYAGRSSATFEGESFQLGFATEQSRPPVRLYATVKDGRAYARLMLTLYALVTSDLRTQKKDRSAYFEWVQQRYLDELSEQQARNAGKVENLINQRNSLKSQLTTLNKEVSQLRHTAYGREYQEAYRKYYNYVAEHDRWLLRLFDPVISVHPDCVVFEAFSVDESSYGRVTVPMQRLDVHGPVDYGTTNIDFSADLAREIGRIRSYRPTDLHVGAGQVVMATTAGAAIEKKIDLPPTWVRGFLQVQSAATLPGLDVKLSAATLAEVLSVLKRQTEDRGPRSLRFVLKSGEKPEIVVEPWNIRIKELRHVYEGRAEEIRLWGRRRLLVLEEVLAHATEVQVRLLGTGMPSYWSVFSPESRFDMGLSGWTQNDWSKSAQFDLLASSQKASSGDMQVMERVLKDRLFVSTEEAANLTQGELSRERATAALQQLCREGRAMYDHITGTYRWRQLFPFMPEPEAVEDERLKSAKRLLDRKAVKWSAAPQKIAEPGKKDAAQISANTDNNNSKIFIRYQAEVHGEKVFEVLIDVDADGRVVYAQCTCGTYRRDKLRKGPCPHILATTVFKG